jgi:hypothetical protein
MTTFGIEPIAISSPEPQDEVVKIAERTWGLQARVDGSVTFEEYVYWAKIERAEEHESNRQYVETRGPLSVGKVIKGRFSKGIHHEKQKQEAAQAAQAAQEASNATGLEKETGIMTVNNDSSSGSVSDEEWKTAARSLRTASWGTIFYLVTTDILGWSSTP